MLIGILVIPCVLVAIGGSAAVGQTENEHFGPVLIGGATIAVTVVPLIVMAWLAWLIDAPPICVTPRCRGASASLPSP